MGMKLKWVRIFLSVALWMSAMAEGDWCSIVNKVVNWGTLKHVQLHDSQTSAPASEKYLVGVDNVSDPFQC
jgi:hypothetical protein